ncbi:hypothetical protein BJF83_12070 [Nocardiopsis sp. CNR-923]|uniref:hypothetical protein n=1 Tax=Nocardiopsis sp. CNR-923 TaxID=1904965 RepID=UPI0009678CA5|nr:hypothetical protein [Nocardiopsis sp. CNR-923]OLT29314.1 hypothetical protein BJF83_12070 [Nocardiopsis sp. CNR-923]
MTTNRDLQRTAARVLAALLDTPNLPEVSWNLYSPGRFTRSYVTADLNADLLAGQADSHQAVRDWAARLGTRVELRRGTTPDARAIVDGIVVRVWCAPEFRDDVNASEE